MCGGSTSHFGFGKRKFSCDLKSTAAQGYEFLSYVCQSKNANIFLARCIPGDEVVSIEQVSRCRDAFNRPFWKWIRHPNILRLLHCFSDDRYTYFVRKDIRLITARRALMTGSLLVDCESTVSLDRLKFLQKWSRQILCAINYLNNEGFHHNEFSWDVVFIEDGNAYLDGFEHLVHFADKKGFGLGDLRYCPPEALECGFIQKEQIMAAESWRFGAHLFEALTCMLISGENGLPFPGTIIPSKKVLLHNVQENLQTLPDYLSATGLPTDVKTMLLGFMDCNPCKRLLIKNALSEVDWLTKDTFFKPKPAIDAKTHETQICPWANSQRPLCEPCPPSLIKTAPENWWRSEGTCKQQDQSPVWCNKERPCAESTTSGATIEYLYRGPPMPPQKPVPIPPPCTTLTTTNTSSTSDDDSRVQEPFTKCDNVTPTKDKNSWPSPVQTIADNTIPTHFYPPVSSRVHQVDRPQTLPPSSNGCWLLKRSDRN